MNFCALIVEMTVLSAAYRWLEDDGPAFGAPGVDPRWTSSEKDAVSTAYAASSRVWFTVSHGTLNEIYYPTIDRPQTRDMELLFSDGETFFHEEKRDLTYDFHYIDSSAPAVRVTASDLQGRYTVTKEFISDPHHPVVLMNVKISGDENILSRLKCYALLAPHLNGGGAGNSALPSPSVVRSFGCAMSCPSQATGANFWFFHFVFTEVPDHLSPRLFST